MYHTPDEEIDETSLKTDYSNFLFALCMQKKFHQRTELLSA